jgi:hypothetical protein
MYVTVNAVKICREWAEEHWETVGMAASIACAIAAATVLILAFNLVSIHLETSYQGAVIEQQPPVSNVRSSGPDVSGSGSI